MSNPKRSEETEETAGKGDKLKRRRIVIDNLTIIRPDEFRIIG